MKPLEKIALHREIVFEADDLDKDYSYSVKQKYTKEMPKGFSIIIKSTLLAVGGTAAYAFYDQIKESIATLLGDFTSDFSVAGVSVPGSSVAGSILILSILFILASFTVLTKFINKIILYFLGNKLIQRSVNVADYKNFKMKLIKSLRKLPADSIEAESLQSEINRINDGIDAIIKELEKSVRKGEEQLVEREMLLSELKKIRDLR